MKTLKRMRKDLILYVMLLPGFIYFTIFHIIPIVNMKLAFQDYKIIGENTWVGMKHFNTLFSSPVFLDVLQ
ncbi:MAG: sugar ABC transporter permease, partial [Solibacillus sp.]